MGKLDLNQADFLFHSDALSDAELHVFSFSGEEELSRTFRFQIELVSSNVDVDLDAPIGQPAYLLLRGHLPDGSRYSRYVHGVVERFVQTGAGIRQSRYQATLVPTVQQLAYSRDSRIFQKQKTDEVVKKVLKDGSVPSDWVTMMLHGSYEPRDYCVQYQESDLDFVQRLLEEEGITYYFEQKKDKDVLCIGDGNHAFEALSEYATVQLRDTPHLYEEGLIGLQAESALRPGAAVMRDYKFKQPGLEMEAKAEGKKYSDHSMYYFPGDYVDPSLGNRLAKMRMQEQLSLANRFIGNGNVRAMLPGYKFTMQGHRRDACNQEYLIVRVEHQGSQPAALGEEGTSINKPVYQNRILGIPAKVEFRPSRSTPRPSIPGVQTAAVVGPAGEEIHCDEHGRVKVQFPWDREGKKDDNSSCWIRVSQPWGGLSYGGMFIPRIGQEVLVQFLEGDPDRPVISGRVYNGENPTPYGLPDKKTVSTFKSSSSPGGNGSNELRFEDAAGSEEIYLHGQLDMNTVIERDRSQKFGRDTTDSVGRDRTRTVANNETLSVGNDRKASVANNETLSVGVDQSQSIGANQTENIGANQTLSVGANQSISVGANQDVQIGANQSLAVGANRSITVGSAHTESIGAAMTVTIGAALTESVGDSYTETVASSMTLSVGSDMSETVGAGKTSSIGSDLSESVGSNRSETVGGDLSTNVTGGVTLEAGKDIGMQAGKAISGKAGKEITLDAGTKVTIVAADEITFKTGSASIVLKSGGDISIKGSKISLKGSGDVVIKGSKIGQN